MPLLDETIDAKKLKQLNLFCTACAMPVFLKDASYKSITKALDTIINSHNNNLEYLLHNIKMHLFQIRLRSYLKLYFIKLGHALLICHFTSPSRRM